MRLDDAIRWFLASWPYEGPRVPTADTVRDYSHALNWLIPFAGTMGRVHAADLDPDLLRAAIRALLDERPDRSPLFKGGEGSARTLITAVRRLANWLTTQGLAMADLTVVKAPRAPERIQARLRPDEFRQLEAVVLRRLVEGTRTSPRITIARDLALLYLLADTGLRASEVCGMTLSDVNFEVGKITVRRGKGRKERAMSIIDPADPRGGATIRLLADWIQHRDAILRASEHDMLWVNLQGSPFKREGLRRVLARICEDAGIDGNRPPHAFRRATFTERYRAQPAAIKVLAARMGWSDKSHHMVSTYTRGADLEFASEVALPSMASLWHEDGQKVPVPKGTPRPILISGVGPAVGNDNDRAEPPRRVGKEGHRPAGQPARGRRSLA